MRLPERCRALLLAADGKALATYSEESGPHVVPVSSVKMDDDNIVLVNYFFGQTLRNIEKNPSVALTFWKGLEGFQIKATARHETDGRLFAEVTDWISRTIPGRVVRGALVLTLTAVFEVSADAARAGMLVLE
jgi:predicted pyridoxine 5'-phosphate oxidase superfamily flavin-nucleotide-binding protein